MFGDQLTSVDLVANVSDPGSSGEYSYQWELLSGSGTLTVNPSSPGSALLTDTTSDLSNDED